MAFKNDFFVIKMSLFQAHLLFLLLRPFFTLKSWVCHHRYYYDQLLSVYEDLACADLEFEKSIEHLPF